MKITVHDCKTIDIKERTNARGVVTPAETRVRFSLTIAEDDGEPWLTMEGWTIARDRTVRPPYSRTAFSSRLTKFVHPSNSCFEEVKAAVLTIPDVQEILGPYVPVVGTGKKLKGSASVKGKG